MAENEELFCSFCGLSFEKIDGFGGLVANSGPTKACICNDCTATCLGIFIADGFALQVETTPLNVELKRRRKEKPEASPAEEKKQLLEAAVDILRILEPNVNEIIKSGRIEPPPLTKRRRKKANPT